MGMQVLLGVCAKILAENSIWKNQERFSRYPEYVVQAKRIEIIGEECRKDHIHMLVRIPPKYSVSYIMGYLKGKSSLMIFDRHANLKYKYGKSVRGNRAVVRIFRASLDASWQKSLVGATQSTG